MNKVLLTLFSLLALVSTSPAKVMDAIALIVEGEAVTTAEIRTVKTQFNVNKQKAIEILIQDRLQTTAMKDILIDEDKIDQKIKEIALQNSVTVPKMRKILKSQGTEWFKYRSSIRDALKKEQFFQTKVIASIPEPTKEELKVFYKNNKKDFLFPKYINLIEYAAKTEKRINIFIKTGKKSKIKSKRIKKLTKKTDSALLSILLSTQNGGFTRVINTGNQYIVYKVISKSGKTHMPFESAQGAVANKWKRKQQNKALEDYFGKLRTRADVQILR